MSSFLYFEPRGAELPDEYSERCGNAITEVFHGPGNKAGNLYGGHHWEQTNEGWRVKYVAKEQTWRQIPNTECWLGFYTEQKPSAVELEKPKTLRGHQVEGWLVPVARDFARGQECCLPAPMDVDDDGKWIRGKISGEFEELWRVATVWWDTIGQAEDENTDIRLVDACDLAVIALSYNYWIGKIEAAALGILLDEFVGLVLDAVCDIPSLNEILKKKRATEQLSTSDGPVDSLMATTPQ